jgi:hypothetical protein
MPRLHSLSTALAGPGTRAALPAVRPSAVKRPVDLLGVQQLVGNRAAAELVAALPARLQRPSGGYAPRGNGQDRVASVQRCGTDTTCDCMEEDGQAGTVQRTPLSVQRSVTVKCASPAATAAVAAAVAAAKTMADTAAGRRTDPRVQDLAFLMFRTRDKAIVDGVFDKIAAAAKALGDYEWDCQDGGWARGCGDPGEYASSPKIGFSVNVCDPFFKLDPVRQAHVCLHESMHFGASLQSWGGAENYLREDCLHEVGDPDASIGSRLANADHHACFARLLASGTDVSAPARGAQGDDLALVAINDRIVQLRGAEFIARAKPQTYEWTAERGGPIQHTEPTTGESKIDRAEHDRLVALGLTEATVTTTIHLVGAPAKALATTIPLVKKPDPEPDPIDLDPPFDGHTTGTLLRVRNGPGLGFPALRLIEWSGTPVVVHEQVSSSSVDGNDKWDRISDMKPEWVSDRYVRYDERHTD